MLDLLKFDITARDRASGHLNKMKTELGGVRGALVGVNDYAKRAGRSMRNMGVRMSAGVTAPMALIGKQAVSLYDKQIAAEKTVAQAILSTGGAAGKTVKDLKGLAAGLQGITTFGDEDILQNVTAPLLTFTKVQGDVFDRAQGSVLDMATLLKMDLKSASLQVGKALNDPVKGVTALSRAGVQFTDDQKAVIESLVETGDVAGAQTLILKELETQFKGQAAAAAATPLGKWRQLGNSIGDVKEQLGEQIVPFLTPLVDKVRDAVQWFGALSPEVKRNIVIFGGLAATVGPVLSLLGLATLGVTSLAGALVSMSALVLANPILAAIAAIAAGAVLIYRNWDGISNWFVNLWGSIKGGAASGWAAVKSTISQYSPEWLKAVWGDLVWYFRLQWALIKHSTFLAWAGIARFLKGEFSFRELIQMQWQNMASFFLGLAGNVKAAFVAIWGAIKAEVAEWPGRMAQYGRETVQGLVNGLRERLGLARKEGALLGGAVESGAKDALQVKSPSRVFMGIGQNVGKGLAIGLRGARREVEQEASKMAQGLAQTGAKSLSFLGSFRDGARTVLNNVLSGTMTFRQSFKSILSGIGGRLLSSGVDALLGRILPFANGGVISGGMPVQAFAGGGVVSRPTYFGMNNGRSGLMGEAGPEAIMPLTRVGGKLGVRAAGGGGGLGGQIDVVIHTSDKFDAEVESKMTGVAVRVSQATMKHGLRNQAESQRRR